jgi:hypothetical protein
MSKSISDQCFAEIESIAEDAHSRCEAASEEYDRSLPIELLPETAATHWWAETKTHHSGKLADKIKALLARTTLTEEGCCVLRTKEPAKVTWRGLRQKAYQLVAWGLCPAIPSQRDVVRHLCNNRRCLRPDHLQVGTQRENLADQRRLKGQITL